MPRIEGHIVDIQAREVFDGAIEITDTRISRIERCPVAAGVPYILPGFVDAHIHIESSMLTPHEWAGPARRRPSAR